MKTSTRAVFFKPGRAVKAASTVGVQVCDATMLNSITGAWYKIVFLLFYTLLLLLNRHGTTLITLAVLHAQGLTIAHKSHCVYCTA